MDLNTLLVQFATQGPTTVLLLYLWWVERQERMALEKRLQEYLESRAEEHDPSHT